MSNDRVSEIDFDHFDLDHFDRETIIRKCCELSDNQSQVLRAIFLCMMKIGKKICCSEVFVLNLPTIIRQKAIK